MPPSSILNLTYGERKNGVKPAHQPRVDNNMGTYQGHQYRQVSNDFSYASASAGRQQGSNQNSDGHQGQQNYNRNQGGHQGRQDNKTGNFAFILYLL